MTLLAAASAPGTTIVTVAETLAANIPAFPLQAPGQAQAIVIRGSVTITAGTTVTALVARLRVGQNNTTTAQVGVALTEAATASVSNTIGFEYEDTVLSDSNSGYSITIAQTGAGTNGTITQVEYSVDLAVP